MCGSGRGYLAKGQRSSDRRCYPFRGHLHSCEVMTSSLAEREPSLCLGTHQLPWPLASLRSETQLTSPGPTFIQKSCKSKAPNPAFASSSPPSAPPVPTAPAPVPVPPPPPTAPPPNQSSSCTKPRLFCPTPAMFEPPETCPVWLGCSAGCVSAIPDPGIWPDCGP